MRPETAPESGDIRTSSPKVAGWSPEIALTESGAFAPRRQRERHAPGRLPEIVPTEPGGIRLHGEVDTAEFSGDQAKAIEDRLHGLPARQPNVLLVREVPPGR